MQSWTSWVDWRVHPKVECPWTKHYRGSTSIKNNNFHLKSHSYHFSAKWFQTFIPLLFCGQIPALWCILWVFAFSPGEGSGGIMCSGGEDSVGKSSEGHSAEAACLTFAHPFHTEPPQSRDDIEILYRLRVKLCIWKTLARGDIIHQVWHFIGIHSVRRSLQYI